MTNPYFLRNILKKNAKTNRQSYTPDLIERAFISKKGCLKLPTLNNSYNKVGRKFL